MSAALWGLWRSGATGVLLAVSSVVLPAFPFGPLAASPPLPLAGLWLAYGWAAQDSGGWRKPAFLFALGLAHDQISGGPFGVMPSLYLGGYVIGGFAARTMSSFSDVTEWAAFLVTAVAAACLAALTANMAMETVGLRPLAFAIGVTVVTFPLVKALYVQRGAAAGG